jgi:diguanylate cyclase (GGDEF)-like protein
MSVRKITGRSWEGLTAYVELLSPFALVIMGITLNVACGVLDYVTGNEVSVSVFYLAPVFVLAWFGNTGSALIMCFVSATTWLLADYLTGHEYSFQWILFWNAAVRFGFYVVVALALGKIRSMNRELERLSRTDSLTGALNSRGFTEVAVKELSRSRRFGHPLALVYLDLDNFKQVNDTLGHSEGDRVLIDVAGTLKTSTRDTDAVGRLGGDEFAVLLTEIAPRQATEVVERLRETLLHIFRQNDWPVTISAGMVSFQDDFPESVDQMIQSADKLMYSAKEAGKDMIAMELPHPAQQDTEAHQ